MTYKLIESEVWQWDKELRKQKRNILLLSDNCPAHPDVKNLQTPNCTSKLQPIDQCVIQSLNINYRTCVLTHILNCMYGNKVFNINVLNVIHFLIKSGDELQSKRFEMHFIMPVLLLQKKVQVKSHTEEKLSKNYLC